METIETTVGMNGVGVIALFILNIIVVNIPLLYGTVGEIVVEKSGSLNLGVEGIMAVGALFGYLCGCYANSLIVGILVAFGTSALCGLLFALLTVVLHANQNITGLTLTTFGLGVYFFVGNIVKSVSWPKIDNYPNIRDVCVKIPIPFLSNLPQIGDEVNCEIFAYIFVILGVAIAVAVWWYFKYSKPGLKLRAIGENPAAADSVGINVNLYKFIHICVGCGIMGIGGYYMGLDLSGSFNAACWINGYGWIAVALVIFAKWNTLLAILGTFVFGFFNALQISGGTLAQAFPNTLGWLSAVPSPLYKALPFIITAIVLVAFSISSKRGGAPAALGTNYFREDR